ncbi:MAG: poly(R)-hydroxyalkanoic acid synthase subunit PhaE [Bacteroidota bacterium]|nr:hypothetical protein [Candidatus Kapabacteria bacterium]MDW8218895.1 poly(R)-hydroxyalkanoic acid synthase subunit PhaE [Bacteroidota bacterium]
MSQQTSPLNFYTEWLQRQNAAIASWNESVQQAAHAFAEGDIKKALKIGVGAYMDAYSAAAEQHSALTRQATEQIEAVAKNTIGSMSNNPWISMENGSGDSTSTSPQTAVNPLHMMQQWSSSIMQMAQPWLQILNQNLPQAQRGIFEPWIQMMETGTSSLSMLVQLAKLYEQWQYVAHSWSASVQKMYSSVAEALPAGAARDTFRNMLSSTTVYVKLLELWAPLIEVMKQGKAPTQEQIYEALHPSKYKPVIDTVFEFMIPEQMHALYRQLQTFAQSLNIAGNQAVRVLLMQMEQNARMIFAMMAHNPEAALNVYTTLMSAYQQAISSMSALPMTQRQSEMLHTVQHLLEHLSEYAKTVATYQHMLYTNGQKALEKITESAFAVGRSKKALSSFDELFKIWVETNEHVFHQLFKTKDYAAVQGKLAHIHASLYKDFEHLFEIALKDFPIVTRSHIDELAKTVAELKHKVRQMEKQKDAEATTIEDAATVQPKGQKGAAQSSPTKRKSSVR